MNFGQFSKPKRKFLNLKTDSEVTGQNYGMYGKLLSPRHVYAKYKWCTSIGIGAIFNFWNLNADFNPKRRLLGQGQGHKGKNIGMHGKVLSHGMCTKY